MYLFFCPDVPFTSYKITQKVDPGGRIIQPLWDTLTDMVGINDITFVID